MRYVLHRVLPTAVVLVLAAGCRTALDAGPPAETPPPPGAALEGAAPADVPAGIPPEIAASLPEGIDPEILKPGPFEPRLYATVIGLPGASFRDAPGGVDTSISRLRLQVRKRLGLGARLSFDAVYETRGYDFGRAHGIYGSPNPPVDRTHGVAMRGRYIQPVSTEWAGFAFGQVRWEAEQGAELGDGFSWGGTVGVGRRFDFGLQAGVGFGVFTLFERDPIYLPTLQFSWDIDERWRTSLDGTQLEVGYRSSPTWDWAAVAGFASSRIRLAEESPGESGIFTDSRITTQIRVTWTPAENTDFELRVGIDPYRELFFADENGGNSRGFRLDPAPVIGVRWTVRF